KIDQNPFNHGSQEYDSCPYAVCLNSQQIIVVTLLILLLFLLIFLLLLCMYHKNKVPFARFVLPRRRAHSSRGGGQVENSFYAPISSHSALGAQMYPSNVAQATTADLFARPNLVQMSKGNFYTLQRNLSDAYATIQTKKSPVKSTYLLTTDWNGSQPGLRKGNPIYVGSDDSTKQAASTESANSDTNSGLLFFQQKETCTQAQDGTPGTTCFLDDPFYQDDQQHFFYIPVEDSNAAKLTLTLDNRKSNRDDYSQEIF
ncbi:hypothetical protein Ciccas_011740, partial [Cichlidogyrus casuarinus]